MPVWFFSQALVIHKNFESQHLLSGYGNFSLRSRYNQGFSDGRDSQSRLNYDRDQSKYDQGFIDGMKAKVRDAMNL